MLKIRDLSGVIIFLIFIYIGGGISAVVAFIKNIAIILFELLKALNSVSLIFDGNHILVLLFGTGITFFIVGIILELINAPKGKIGKILGSFLFWLVGVPVSFILNVIGLNFFN